METTLFNAKTYKISLWALIISILAFIFSFAFPLVKEKYLDSPDLKIEFSNPLDIYQSLGRIVFAGDISVSNKGNALGIIKQIKVFIKNKNSNFKELLQIDRTCEHYFAPISILPNNSFSCAVFFSSERTNEAQKNDIQLIIDSDNDLFSNRDSSDNPKEISPAVFKRIVDYSENNLKQFQLGEYEMIIVPYDEKGIYKNEIKFYKFTVYEYMIAELRKTFDNYKYGIEPPDPSSEFNYRIPIKLTTIETDSEKKNLLKEFENYQSSSID